MGPTLRARLRRRGGTSRSVSLHRNRPLQSTADLLKLAPLAFCLIRLQLSYGVRQHPRYLFGEPWCSATPQLFAARIARCRLRD